MMLYLVALVVYLMLTASNYTIFPERGVLTLVVTHITTSRNMLDIVFGSTSRLNIRKVDLLMNNSHLEKDKESQEC